ncbi:hypothetical protein [Pseudomonas sp. BP8]|uniref:hypothetical protein n=1 Tax=Pseudomonas sp. BP8 TaxID=2817864 RepID=UPI001AE34BD8|nr:hypothetical protein [Pseudomonas sp. BP8]MBP2259654.1 hypothetical protein [Pseudomonas sp. BP8]HDS1733670.1 hypothetical protein [Pseudomonas putida]
MSNVIDFSKVAKARKAAEAFVDPLDRVKAIMAAGLEPNTSETFKRVKELLHSRNYKFQLTSKNFPLPASAKNKVILFPKTKTAFILFDKKLKISAPPDWQVKLLSADKRLEPIAFIELISKYFETLEQNDHEKDRSISASQ